MKQFIGSEAYVWAVLVFFTSFGAYLLAKHDIATHGKFQWRLRIGQALICVAILVALLLATKYLHLGKQN